jgi:polysaccharide export outer membrane protein
MLIVAAGACWIAGCQHDQRRTLLGTPFDPQTRPDYLLQPGDKLQIRYASDPNLDQEVLVRSDGKISLPHVGDIQAAPMHPADLSDLLNERYAGVMTRPDITVIVAEESGRRVYMGGEVRRPGSMPLHPNETLAQAVFDAGGFTNSAHTKQVVVIRGAPSEKVHVLEADLDRILAGADPDVLLQPLDIVHVPMSPIAKIGLFVDQYINALVPRSVSVPLLYELHNQPLEISGNQSTFPVEITRSR